MSNILLRLFPRLKQSHGLEFKNCFGAVAGYTRGKIFISAGKFGIALKLPPQTVAILLGERGAKHLKYFPNGHIKKDYVVLPKKIIEDETRMKKLIAQSLRFAKKKKRTTLKELAKNGL